MKTLKLNQWAISALLFTSMVLATAFGAGQALAEPTTWTVNDGTVDAVPCDDVTPDYTSIQAAVDVASEGDTVMVCPGTYTEQVTVETNNISLVSVIFREAIIEAPGAMAEPQAVIHVKGATQVSISDFTINAPNPQFAKGIYVGDNGDATIVGNLLDGSLVGILIGSRNRESSATATIANNEIFDYKIGGIVVDYFGSDATISENVIATTFYYRAQNGVQISFGATGTVKRNNISGNWYPNINDSATGILIFETDDVMIQRNTLTDNQVGVYIAAYGWKASGSDGNKVIRNTITGSSTAVILEAGNYWGPNLAIVENNKVTNNTLSCNGGDEQSVWIGGQSPDHANNNKVIHNTIDASCSAPINDIDGNAKVQANVIDE